jgi:hydrogenase small subunit
VSDFLARYSIGTPVINVPGCPPHPDWTVYPVAYILAMTDPGGLPAIAVPDLDVWGRPKAVFSGTAPNPDDLTPFCYDCANQDTQGTPFAAQELGDSGCLAAQGCKGVYTVGDCPIRGKNTTDDGDSMNWCVGAQGQNNGFGGVNAHVGSARHPCQGCIMPDFPDWKALTNAGDKTSKRIKGFYNK